MSPTNKPPLPPPSTKSGAAAGAPPPPAPEQARAGTRNKWVAPAVILAFVVGLAAVVAAGGLFGSKSNSNGKSSKVVTDHGPTSTVAGASGSAASIASTASTVSGSGAAAENQPVTVGAGDDLPSLGDNKGTDAAVGMKPPVLSGSSFDGSPVTITPGGSPKLILFVAHWCPHCQREVPKIVQWIASGAAPKGLEIAAVSTAVKKDAANYPPSAWLSKVGFTRPVLADDAKQDAARAWGLPGYPYFVLLKADGTVAKRYSGEIEMADLTTLITDALVT
jgi:cytochrome c biogenesis protein CcmG, thiol:disulfide interchange protein DsbE